MTAISRKELDDALGKANLALSHGIDIYKQLQISFERKWIVFTGMSSDTMIKTTIKTERIELEPSEFAVHPEVAQAVHTLPDGAIDLSLKTGSLHVVSEHGPSFRFRIGRSEHFPKIKLKTTPDATIPGEVIRKAANYLAPPKSDTMLIKNHQGLISFVSTDSYRLALVETEVEYQGEDAIVPIYLFGLAEKVFDLDTPVSLIVDEHRITLRQESTLVSVRRSEKKFPKYESMFEKFSPTGTFEVERRVLMEALNRAYVVSGAYIPIKFSLMPTGATGQTVRVDVGQSDEQIEGKWDSDDLEINFNVSFMRGILDSLTGSTVKLVIEDSFTQFRIVSDDDPMAIFVMMPIRPLKEVK